jgi:hypothetical protein
LPRYQIVAAGIVKVDGTSRVPVYNSLTASRRPNGTIALQFKGYTPPPESSQYIVKAMVVNQRGAEGAVVTFNSFGSDAIGIVLSVANVTPEVFPNLELMVEISFYEGEGVQPTPPITRGRRR